MDPETRMGAQVYWSKNDFGIGGNRQDIQEYGKNNRYKYSRYDLPYNLREGKLNLNLFYITNFYYIIYNKILI